MARFSTLNSVNSFENMTSSRQSWITAHAIMDNGFDSFCPSMDPDIALLMDCDDEIVEDFLSI